MAFIRHLTLVASTPTTVTLDAAANASTFEVLNRNGADEVFISYDGTATPANPTVEGNDFDVVPAAGGAAVQLRRIGAGNIVVKLISAAATKVSVRGIA